MTDIFKLKGNVYAFDSTTIPLCLSVFWWAKFRKKKGGVKAHVLYDYLTGPDFNGTLMIKHKKQSIHQLHNHYNKKSALN